jgi:hypothetical protein
MHQGTDLLKRHSRTPAPLPKASQDGLAYPAKIKHGERIFADETT